MPLLSKLSAAAATELKTLSAPVQAEIAALAGPLESGWVVTIKTNAGLFAAVAVAAALAGAVVGHLV